MGPHRELQVFERNGPRITLAAAACIIDPDEARRHTIETGPASKSERMREIERRMRENERE
jgi:hypothetical protein